MARKTFTLYVSPLGNDNWSGRRPDPDRRCEDGPFATIARARDELRQQSRRRKATVEIRGGNYPLAEAITFGPQDSGTRDAPITYRARRREVPVLDAGRVITGWQPLEKRSRAIQPAARGKLWVARLPKHWSFLQLFCNGRELPRSKSVLDDDWGTWPQAPLGKRKDLLAVRKRDLPKHDRCENAVLNFLPTPYTMWSNAIVPVRKVDYAKELLRFEPVLFHRPEVLKEIPWRLENLLSGITTPGQWFVNAGKGRLYLWPPDDEDPNQSWITAPWLTSAVEVAGSPDQPVEHLRFQGLNVVRTALQPLDRSKPRSAFGAPGAAIRMAGVEHVTVRCCTLRDLEANAVQAAGHVRRCTITECTITRCGGAGINLGGGLKDPDAPCAHNRITENHIYDCGTIYWHSSAINAGMSEKNIIRNNEIHDMPYAAIMTSGKRHRWFAGWPRRMDDLIDFWKRRGTGKPTILKVKEFLPGHNRIERNLIRNVMLRLDDGAAIYCHAGHHNVMRNNIVIGTPRDGSHGLYFDDEECFSLMEDNIVIRVPDVERARRGSAIHIHNNAGNTIRNNIVIGADVLFTFPNSYGGHKVERNIFVFSDSCRLRSHPTPVMGPGDGRRQDGWVLGPSAMDNNLYWSAKGAKPVKAFIKEMQALGYDHDSVIADPKFVGPEEALRLAKDSPARKLGFKPIDVSKIGRTKP